MAVEAAIDKVVEDGKGMVQEPEGEDEAPQQEQTAPNGTTIDFSTLDFATLSPQDLEKLYIASVNQAKDKRASHAPVTPRTRAASLYNPTTMPTATNGLAWDNHPSTMMVHLEDIKLNKPATNIVVKFSFRHRKFKTSAGAYPNGHGEMKFKFDVTYHALLFDYLKVDVYEAGFLGSHIGRAHIRLSRLPQVLGDIEHTYSLNHRKAHRSPKLAGKQIGEITIGFSFIGGRRSTRSDRSYSTSSGNPPLSPSIPGHRNRMDSNVFPVDEMTGNPDHEQEAAEFLEYLQNEQQNGDAESIYARSRSKSFDETRSVISMRTSSSSNVNEKKRRPTLISENTLLGLKEVSELASAFFGTGWKISKVEFARALMFVQKYYAKYHPNPRTNDIVTDERQIRVACYFLNYAMTAYGSLVLNYFGYGKGYARDFVRPKNDSKTACEHLGLARSDMLAYDFELKLFKPQFFIARDPKLNAIVVVIRGTFNVHECITDACAEYEPFSHGYAHRGFLRCAQYLEDNFLDRIKGWVRQYKCNAVYLSAHSLGAGVSALFTMLLHGHLEEFREIAGNSKFKLKCYNVATPPCVNEELCKEFEPFIENYVNENDIVPRASFGAIMDFRELLKTAHGLLNEKKLSTQERMTRLANHHTHLKQSNEHPKVYIPGTIYYMYKTSRVLHSSTKRPPKEDEINEDAVTGNPLIDDIVPHYLVERSQKELFCNIQFKNNFLYHHFPNKYDNALRKAHDYLEEKRDEVKRLK
ncbi:hypothetical protein SpCBS45565_g02326 [Spizellomyces sp. 'palustris']|nr:hypothetical protein SpCBS45565_g02326 [Spizellomyces sp. 'palustris']